MKKEKEIVRIIKDAAKKDGTPILGALTWWSLEGAVIGVTELKALYKKHGLGEEWLPGEITGSTAFSKTVREVKRMAQGYMIRPIRDDEEQTVVGVVSEEVAADKDKLTYDQEVTIHYHKGDQTITASDDMHPVVHVCRDVYQKMVDTYVVHDFIRLLTRNVRQKMNGIVVRPTGGVYFVPQGPMMEILLQHAAAFNELGDVEFTVVPMHGDPITKAAIANKTRKALEQELQEIQEELGKFKECEPRRDTLERRVNQFKELKQKAMLFADMLAIKVDDLHTSLDEASSFITKMLNASNEKMEKSKEAAAAAKADYAREWKRKKSGEHKRAREQEAPVSMLKKTVSLQPKALVPDKPVKKVSIQKR